MLGSPLTFCAACTLLDCTSRRPLKASKRWATRNRYAKKGIGERIAFGPWCWVSCSCFWRLQDPRQKPRSGPRGFLKILEGFWKGFEGSNGLSFRILRDIWTHVSRTSTRTHSTLSFHWWLSHIFLQQNANTFDRIRSSFSFWMLLSLIMSFSSCFIPKASLAPQAQFSHKMKGLRGWPVRVSWVQDFQTRILYSM